MAEQRSPIGGQTPLSSLKDTAQLNGDILTRLHSAGILDAEQLVGLMQVEGTPVHLAEHLKVDENTLKQLVQSVTAALPPEAQVIHPSLAQGPFALGALEPTERSKADTGPLAEAAAPVSLPTAVNHKAGMQPIQNQSQRGTCVGFGGTALTEYLWHTKGNNTKLSEEFLYEETKKIDGQPNACGTWLVYAMRVVASLGICPEAVWPYNPSLPCNHGGEPGNARPGAVGFRTGNHMITPNNILAMKAALAQNSNVAICFRVYNSWYRSSSPTARTGAITMRLNNEASVGGHCMCVVGYQDNAAYPGGGYFIVRNSWGTAWAYQCVYGAGYGTMPYQYMINDGTEAASIP